MEFANSPGGATTVIGVRANNTAPYTSFKKSNIVRFDPLYVAAPPLYRYPTATMVTISMNDGSRVTFEMQDVANQAAWKLGTQAALASAIADLNSWL